MKVSFIRTSTTDQTPELQLGGIRTMVSMDSMLIIKEHQSAFKENVPRPELEKLKELIKKREVTELYVWHIDRLFRNRKKLIAFLTFCRSFGVNVISYNQQWLESIQKMPEPFNEAMFDFMLQIIAWTAEDESKTKSNRVKMAVKKTVDNKTVSYKGNLWGRKPIPTQVVSKVKLLHSEGHSIRDISKLVTVYDRNNNGRHISKSAVHKIVSQNPS